jgi:GGDEF domain-containing protein
VSAEIQWQALFDAETGAPTAVLLLDRTERAIARSRRTQRHVAVYVVVDDAHKDPRVPADWRAMVASLSAALRSDDTVARVALDAFVVICGDVPDEQAAETIRQRLDASTDDCCRIGVALNSGAETGLALIRRAFERAMR